MPFEYLVNAANRMYELLHHETVNLEETQIREAAILGCNTLRQVLRDRAFIYEVVPQLQSLRDSDRRTFEIVVADFNHFTASFLPLEARILVGYGIRPELAEMITHHALELRKAIANWTSTPEDVSANIRRLSESVCSLAQELEQRETILEQQRQAEEALRRRHRQLAQAGTGLFGLATIAINYLALGQGLFSQAGAAGSGAVGEAILGAAAGTLLESM